MHEIIAGKLTLKKQNTTGVLIEPSDKFKKHIKKCKIVSLLQHLGFLSSVKCCSVNQITLK